jgi:hypothetical protein
MSSTAKYFHRNFELRLHSLLFSDLPTELEMKGKLTVRKTICNMY